MYELKIGCVGSGNYDFKLFVATFLYRSSKQYKSLFVILAFCFLNNFVNFIFIMEVDGVTPGRLSGLPPGNDKIRRTLLPKIVPQKNLFFFNLNFCFVFKSAEFPDPRKSGSPGLVTVAPVDTELHVCMKEGSRLHNNF